MRYSLIPWEDPCISFRKLWLSPYHFMSESQPSMLTNVCSAFDGVGNRWTKRSTTKFEKPCRCNAFTCQQQMQLPTQDLHSSSKFPSLLRFKNTCKNIRKLIKNSLQLGILNIFERSLPLTTWTPKASCGKASWWDPNPPELPKAEAFPAPGSTVVLLCVHFRKMGCGLSCWWSVAPRCTVINMSQTTLPWTLSISPSLSNLIFSPLNILRKGPHSLQTACLGFWNLRGVKLKEAAGEDATYIRHLRLCQDHLGSFKIFFHMFGTPQKTQQMSPLKWHGLDRKPYISSGQKCQKKQRWWCSSGSDAMILTLTRCR